MIAYGREEINNMEEQPRTVTIPETSSMSFRASRKQQYQNEAQIAKEEGSRRRREKIRKWNNQDIRRAKELKERISEARTEPWGITQMLILLPQQKK